ncbi:retrotransposon protein, putative, ty1-copia subclass [Tanacetum coccineum]
MARKPFTHASKRADDLLGIIHSDVCGPFRTTSREGANYCVTFTDDFSRYGYVSARIPQAPERYGFYIDAEEHELGDHGEHPNYRAALSDLESEKWLKAVNAEIKWLFKKKTDMDGNIHTYKARLVAKGFTQTYKVKFEETFSPVVDIKAIRILIDIAAYYDYEIWQMDVKTAFLNGRLNKDVYMLLGAKTRDLMRRSKSMVSLKIPMSHVYKRASRSIIIFLILYVDDILLMGNNILMLQDVKSWHGKYFAMKDLGEATYILGIKIYRDRSRRLISLSQNAYIDKILKRFKMDTSKRGTIPMQPNVDLRKSQGPSTPAEVKRMKGIHYASAVGSIIYTKDMFLIYGGDSTTELSVTCYTNASWETDRDDLRSQTGFVFVMNGGAVDWKSSKQSTTAMSSMEVEYIAVAEAAIKAIWMRKFISGLGLVPSIDKPIDIYCENTCAITLVDKPGVQKGAKIFRRKYHFICKVIQEGDIRILKVHTNNNLVDPLTKPMPCTKHVEHARSIGLRPAGSFM